MDEEDYTELVPQLQKLFRGAGLSDLADERLYFRDGAEGAYLPGAKDLLLDMLLAFDDHLALRDKGNYERALAKIGDLAKTPDGIRAVITDSRREEPVRRIHRDLSELPDLQRLRKRLHRLRRELADQTVERYRER